MRAFGIVCLIVVMVSVSGCGYRFSGSGGLPNDVKRVFVAMLENRTEETGIESIVTNDLIYEFARSDTLAKNESLADATLSGTVDSITKGTISRIGINTSQERRVTVMVSFQLSDRQAKVIWKVNRFSENETYLVEKDKETTEQHRRAAIEKLSKRLAEKIYHRLTDNF